MIRKNILLIFFLMQSLTLWSQMPCALDNTFSSDGTLVSDGGRIADCIVSLPDGKSIVAYNPMSTGHVYLRKLNADGSVDNTFGSSGKVTLQVASSRTEVKDMILYNNQLYCCGTTNPGSNTYPFFARLHLTGKLDSTFAYNGYNYHPQHYSYNSMAIENGTGKLLIGGMKDFDEIVVTRVHTSGYVDGNFGNLGTTTFSTAVSGEYYDVRHLNLDKNNKIILTGKYHVTQGNTFSKTFVARLNEDGTKDNTFGNGGISYYTSATGNYDEGRKIYANAANDYYVIGATWKLNLDYDYALLKVKNNGQTDNNFNGNGWKLYDLGGHSPEEYLLNGAQMPNGNFLLTGNQGAGDTVYFAMLMVKPDGSVDNSFGPNGLFKNIFGVNNNNSSAAVSLTNDGKIYLGGYTRTCTNGTCGPLSAGVSRYMGGQQAANGIHSFSKEEEIKIYPNVVAAGAWHFIESQRRNALDVQAFDQLGSQIDLETEGNRCRLITTSSGSYFLSVGEKGKSKQVFRITVK